MTYSPIAMAQLVLETRSAASRACAFRSRKLQKSIHPSIRTRLRTGRRYRRTTRLGPRNRKGRKGRERKGSTSRLCSPAHVSAARGRARVVEPSWQVARWQKLTARRRRLNKGTIRTHPRYRADHRKRRDCRRRNRCSCPEREFVAWPWVMSPRPIGNLPNGAATTRSTWAKERERGKERKRMPERERGFCDVTCAMALCAATLVMRPRLESIEIF